jgi:hypothetical protein
MDGRMGKGHRQTIHVANSSSRGCVLKECLTCFGIIPTVPLVPKGLGLPLHPARQWKDAQAFGGGAIGRGLHEAPRENSTLFGDWSPHWLATSHPSSIHGCRMQSLPPADISCIWCGARIGSNQRVLFCPTVKLNAAILLANTRLPSGCC